jgi:2-dehydropantoate 2-reductase
MPLDELLIVGSGAMACYFAAQLAPFTRVTLMGTWRAGLDAIESDGIRITNLSGKESQVRVVVVREPPVRHGVKAALVLVKAWQTDRAAKHLETCLASDGVALTLQNGLGNLEHLQAVLGEGRATLGVTTTGATLLGPGRVRHGGEGPIFLGPYASVDLLAETLAQAGFEIQRKDDLNGLIWSKLAVNAAINPLTALLEVRNGQLLNQPATKELMAMAAREVADLAQALGIQLATENVVEYAFEVAGRTSANLSSMLQDIQRKAPTEIDAICGAISRLAADHEVRAPLNDGYWKLISAKAAFNTGDTP